MPNQHLSPPEPAELPPSQRLFADERADDESRYALESNKPPPSVTASEQRTLQSTAFHYGLFALCLAAALTLLPLWAPLLLASWMAMVVRPLYERLVKRVKGSGRAAAVVTVLLVLAALTPLTIMTLSLLGAAGTLLDRLDQPGGARDAMQALFASGSTPRSLEQLLDPRELMTLARRHGGGALNAATRVFGAATAATIGLFVFIYGFYTFLVDSRRVHQWLLDHSPLERWESLRLSQAYEETGRGLLIGVGLTAVFQGAVATVGYLIIGVPQALVLGLLTMFAALIPSVGTGLVWAPLTAGLALTGLVGEAIAVLVLGCVIAVADNFVRPALSRHAHLDLPMFLLFVAMLGGIAMFGAWGLLAGPLFVRLGVEALRLGRERKELGQRRTAVETRGPTHSA